MARPVVLQSAFERMIRDVPRDRMPPGSCWTLKDWIPGEKQAPAARRGGWAYASPNLTTINANVTYVSSVVYAPSLTPPLVCVGRSAATRLFTVTDTSTASDKGNCDFPAENPKFYRGLVILCDWDGTSLPSSWDGTTLSTSLSGSPPSGSRSCAYKDHFVLAGSSTNTERMWFSGPGDPTSWDTTSGYLDTTGPITGLHAFRDMILIFHEGTMERLLGSIPPPGSDMTRGPLFDTGTKYPGSITGSDSFCCFANASSVYMTDGNELVDLAADGGMRSYWQSLFGTTGRIVSGVFARGWYFVSVASASSLAGAAVTHLATFMINVQTRAWVELGNVEMFGSARALGDKEELYWGSMTEARVNTGMEMFDGTAKADGDGTAVTPTLETPYYNVGQSKGRWRNIYVTYDMSDAATDNPTMALSYILDPDDTSYTAVVGQDGNAYPLAETTEQTRVRRQVGKATFGAAFKLVQSNASGKTMLRRLEAELHAREESRV